MENPPCGHINYNMHSSSYNNIIWYVIIHASATITPGMLQCTFKYTQHLFKWHNDYRCHQQQHHVHSTPNSTIATESIIFCLLLCLCRSMGATPSGTQGTNDKAWYCHKIYILASISPILIYVQKKLDEDQQGLWTNPTTPIVEGSQPCLTQGTEQWQRFSRIATFLGACHFLSVITDYISQ